MRACQHKVVSIASAYWPFRVSCRWSRYSGYLLFGVELGTSWHRHSARSRRQPVCWADIRRHCLQIRRLHHLRQCRQRDWHRYVDDPCSFASVRRWEILEVLAFFRALRSSLEGQPDDIRLAVLHSVRDCIRLSHSSFHSSLSLARIYCIGLRERGLPIPQRVERSTTRTQGRPQQQVRPTSAKPSITPPVISWLICSTGQCVLCARSCSLPLRVLMPHVQTASGQHIGSQQASTSLVDVCA